MLLPLTKRERKVRMCKSLRVKLIIRTAVRVPTLCYPEQNVATGAHIFCTLSAPRFGGGLRQDLASQSVFTVGRRRALCEPLQMKLIIPTAVRAQRIHTMLLNSATGVRIVCTKSAQQLFGGP